MRQYETVIKVMEDQGGYATLGLLYQKALKVPGVQWKTRTPFASIRRIVQDERFFFKIKPGLWALKAYRNRLPVEILPKKDITEAKVEEYNHAYYQGLLLEIGNLKNLGTSIPPQDKRKRFMEQTLGEIATVKEFHKFGYSQFVRKAKTIDVVWFNERRMPVSFFEVEHTTDFSKSLLKFVELQDFHAEFSIVADEVRRRQFDSRISYSAFQNIAVRVRFLSYDTVTNWHSRTTELSLVEREIIGPFKK